MAMGVVDAAANGDLGTLVAPDADAWGTFSSDCALSDNKVSLAGAPDDSGTLAGVPLVSTKGHAACKNRFVQIGAYDRTTGCASLTVAGPGNWTDGSGGRLAEIRTEGHARLVMQRKALKLLATAKPVALVTGISGMIGSFVARELLARGYEVHGVVRYRTHWGNLRGLMHAVSWHKGDITDEGFVLNLLNELRPDCVFHFAAQSLNGVSGDAPKLTMDVNVGGTPNLQS
ncbi:hypothetical protein T484DRAFT_1853782 [Baffinella frigidus]|nr:hypothetical protein T484DRAFT_1853782 [Cryptophyta sp. CCMP2293]